MQCANKIDFAALMEPLAAILLGPPNPRLSKPPNDVRYGTHGSMSVNITTGEFFDHERNIGGGVLALIRHVKGLDHSEAIGWLRGQGVLKVLRGTNRAVKPPPATPKPPLGEIAGEYDYCDETGTLLFQVVRYAPKTFRQRHREGGDWIWNINGVRRVLYRLGEVIAAVQRGATIHIAEGEKDCDNLRDLGLIATTCPGGALKWRAEYSEFLLRADIVIIPDNDHTGRDHADQVAGSLAGIAKRVRVLDLARHWPECPTGGDVSDWLEAGGAVDQLAAWIASSSEWKPAAALEATPQEADWPQPKELPSELAKVAAFDSSFLPEKLAPWVGDISDRLQCPPDYVAVSAITALGATIGRRIAIAPQMKTDWIEVPNLWGAFVGRPGMLKSPAMNEALKPLRHLEAEAAKTYEIAQEAYSVGISEFKLRQEVKKSLQRDHLRKTGGNDAGEDGKPFSFDLGEEPKEPVAVRYRTNDSSYERLGELLVDNPGGILIERDELISLLRQLDRDDQANARGFYLSGWSGSQPYTFDRIVRGHKHIDAVCISVLGNTQPSRIAEYVRRANADGGGGDGLIQRFGLLVWPDSCPDWRNVDEFPDSKARDTAREVFRQASEVTLEEAIKRGATKTVYEPVPFLRFDETAHGEFLEWRTDLEARLRRGELSAAMEGHLAKYKKLAPALALINHIADGGDGPVSVQALRRALAFARHLESHARRVYGAHNTIEVAAAKAILAHIRNGDIKGPFTARDIHQHDWSRLTDRTHVQLGLDLLVELGYLAAASSGAGERGGRPTTTYEINPRALK
jgi:hypothetical protein